MLPATLYPGDFSPSDVFSAAANQILSFSSVTGVVGCNFALTNGPDGSCFPGVSTTVTSYGGLSGISVNGQNMFLVGVFLDDTEPSGAGPAILSYGFGAPGGLSTSDASFSPEINQVFFIGDGLTGTGSGQIQNFLVPDTADRLYLGFADSFDSVPSYYADNVGSLTATFSITGSAAVPEPSTIFLVSGCLLVGVCRFRRRRVVQ
ncbi:MAG TPA: PEP-CTERM sorting domain-containing protein [Bryobacteraceae bacterium]